MGGGVDVTTAEAEGGGTSSFEIIRQKDIHNMYTADVALIYLLVQVDKHVSTTMSETSVKC